MNTHLTRAFFHACHQAKRIVKYLPPLPEWMTPRQIQVIDALHELSQQQETVRPSDIAARLQGTQPSITRMLTDLEHHGALTKVAVAGDRRSHGLALTPYGEELYYHYVGNFHSRVAELFADLDEDEMRATIRIIDQAEQLLRAEARNHADDDPL